MLMPWGWMATPAQCPLALSCHCMTISVDNSLEDVRMHGLPGFCCTSVTSMSSKHLVSGYSKVKARSTRPA